MPSGEIVILAGAVPAAIVGVPSAVREPVEVLREYMETLLVVRFTTYTDVPSDEMVMPYGRVPATIVGVARGVSAEPPSETDLLVNERLTVEAAVTPVALSYFVHPVRLEV